MVTLEGALAAAATLVALAFTFATFERWLARRRPHELAWSLSLAMFTVASAALWLGSARGWDAPTFRVFYLFGAILNVPWLALGTIYLLAGPAVGHRIAAGLAVVSGFATGVLLVAPLEAAPVADDLPRGSDVFGLAPRILAASCSGAGAVIVVGGALLSAWRLRRGRARSAGAGPVAAPRRLAAANVAIAAGTLVLAASGSLNARLGAMTAFAVTLVVGICLLFSGFLLATAPPSAAAGPRRTATTARAARAERETLSVRSGTAG